MQTPRLWVRDFQYVNAMPGVLAYRIVTSAPNDLIGEGMAKRVLIADDSDSVRKLIQSVVEQQDIEVCALTGNGIEAVDKATDLEPDLLILDVQMPGLNGIVVADIMRRRLPNAKIILFTIYGDAVKSIAASVGANAVLAKADGLSGLARTVQSLLGAE